MVIALIFKEGKSSEKAVEFVREKLEKTKFSVTSEDTNILTVCALPKLVNAEAEDQMVYKVRVSPDVGPWLTFETEDGQLSLSEFVAANEDDFKTEEDKLWTPAEEVLLNYRALSRLTVDVQELRKECGLSDAKAEDGATKENHNLLLALQREDIVQEIALLHHHPQRRALPRVPTMCGLSAQWLDSMKDYFGAKVAFYFVFMRCFTVWLILPGVIGMLIFLLRPSDVTVDNSTVAPFFSAFMVIYSTIFVRLIDRENASWACRWGMTDVNKRAKPRGEFYGEWEMSPVTGELAMTYPQWKRFLWYLFSAFITSLMLVVSFGVMILSLNLQGYIHNPRSLSAEGMERFGSPFYVEMIASWAEPLALFDPTGAGDTWCFGYITFVPVILHSMMILLLNSIYSTVADFLTALENHETEGAHTTSLCLKRFFFEAFDCYIVLFYIAFFMRDVDKLRSELVGLYTVDTFRRVLLETVVPLCKQQLTSKVRQRKVGKTKKEDGSSASVSPLVEELEKAEYEDFDDWLEMVIEFGYITLFAGAFPLAACLSFFCNVAEICSDAFKLTQVYRRPMAESAARMPATWVSILKSMVVMSILTNCLIFSVCSSQMETWFPSLYAETEFDQQRPKSQAVWITFLVEHVLFAVCGVCYALLPSVPSWVSIALQRREHFTDKLLHEDFMNKRIYTTSTSKLGS